MHEYMHRTRETDESLHCRAVATPAVQQLRITRLSRPFFKSQVCEYGSVNPNYSDWVHTCLKHLDGDVLDASELIVMQAR